MEREGERGGGWMGRERRREVRERRIVYRPLTHDRNYKKIFTNPDITEVLPVLSEAVLVICM